MRRVLDSPIALCIALLSFALLGLLVAGWRTCAWFTVGVVVAAVPGWFACRVLYGVGFARRLDSLGHVLFLGILVTTLLSVALAAFGLRLTAWTALTAAFGGAAVLFGLQCVLRRPLSTYRDDDPSATRAATTVGVLLVLIVVSGPFLNVGRKVDGNYAYAPYFNRDFFRNVAFAAQLSKGVVPPANPYFAGEALHYYWFDMVFPALVYRASGGAAILEDVFLLSTLLIDVAFVFVFVRLLRQFVRRLTSVLVVLALAIVAESYQAPFKAILALQPTHWALEGTWLGAIALPPVGYFFQGLLYIPHHFAAVVGLVVAVSLLTEQSPSGWLGRTVGATAILVAASGFSMFVAAAGFVWAGSYFALCALRELYVLLRSKDSALHRRRLVGVILCGSLVGVGGLISYGMMSSLEMLLEDASGWHLSVSRSLPMAPVHFFVMLGPMSVLGLAGFVVTVRDPERRVRWEGVLWLVVCVLFLVVFLLPPAHLGLWEVSQKLGLVLRVPVLVLCGGFLDYLLDRGIARRRLAWSALLLFCASAIPNLLAYEYVHLNIRDSSLLTYLPVSERQANEWIRAHTPLSATVQGWPGWQTFSDSDVRTASMPALIPVFGERATAVGDPQFARYFVPLSRRADVDARTAEISRVFEDPAQADVARVLGELQIEYLYWGVAERQCCSDNLAWLEGSPLFEVVYQEDGVSILRFKDR